MDYQEKTIQLKNGKTCLFRLAEEGDAEMMLEYLKATSGETPYMIREPEEVRTSVEEERAFLARAAANPRGMMLSAFVDGELAGNCSFEPVSLRNRMRHRCGMGISLYQKFCGMGIGTALMREVLAAAKSAGYEQAELEVVSTNTPAIALYQKMGFETTGAVPHAFRYRDGTYADFLFMVKNLT